MDKQKSKFKTFLAKTKNFFLELFFPSNFTCDICAKEMDHQTKYHVCQQCEENYLNVHKICPKCGSEIDEKYNLCYACRDKQVFYKMARAPFVYRDKVKDAIHNFKYHNAKYLAQTFGNYMTNVIVRENFEFDLIVPVPLTKKRQKSRGYNQSELLANQISNNLGAPVVSDVLQRTKFSRSQTELTSSERYQNLEDCFETQNKDKIKGKKILLVDDVMTTGATVEACSKLLMDAGANVVYVCSACRTSSKNIS